MRVDAIERLVLERHRLPVADLEIDEAVDAAKAGVGAGQLD